MATTSLTGSTPRRHLRKQSREARRLALARRQGLFGGDSKGAAVRRALSLQDLEQAFRLVHSAYVEAGYILPEPTGMRVRPYEALPEMATFIGEFDGQVVGVLGLVGDSADMGLPSDEAFRDAIDGLRATGARLSETTNQAIRPDFRGCALTTELLRCMIAQAVAEGHDEIIAAASPGHEGFYTMMGFRRIADVRSYSSKVYDPVVALSFNLRERDGAEEAEDHESFLRRFLYTDNPFRELAEDWQERASGIFRDPPDLCELFATRSGMLARCTPSELAAIRRRWTPAVFDKVMALVASGKDYRVA